jgi:ppGpp synthetase/RelA/SpoT-type nucleotidyltranferase
MKLRTAEDYLREEYSVLLPEIRHAAAELETQVKHLLLPVTRTLARHEQLIVKSRVKECESAIESLTRRIELATLARSKRDHAPSLTMLNDLAGVRVLAFPKCRVIEIDKMVRHRFSGWTPDPVPALPGCANSLALKYHGYLSESGSVRAEIQLISMLVGMFWEVEHAALYKPGAHLRAMGIALKMQARYADVIHALNRFEAEFDALANMPLPEGERADGS